MKVINFSMKSILITIIFFMNYFSANSQIIENFNQLINVTQKGDITHASNTVLYCNGSTAIPLVNGCATANIALPGSGNPFPSGAGVANNNGWNNNTFTMQNYDQDGTGVVAGINTFNSSNARLSLGASGGCGVIYAVLVWGGNISNALANYGKRDSIYFRPPNSTNYVGLKADTKIDNSAGATTYSCYKDVTNLVKSGGSGNYWAGNIVASTGTTNLCAGWSLVVVYSDPNLALRNLVIYKGYVNISNAAAPQGPQNIDISGFFTPPSPAPVNLKLGAFAIEGDIGTIGDSLKFKGNIGSGIFEPVYNNSNYQNNFFNSSITREDTAITRLPSYANTLGYDADIVTLDNASKKYLGNSATSATIRLTTAGDQYWVFLLTSAIDVFEPDIRVEKSYTNITSPGATSANPGDIIEFLIKTSNKGSDPADSLMVTDSLYGGGIYVPGSMQIVTGQNSGVKTDGAGDDQMDFDAVANVVKARLGIGANGTQGGKLKNINPADSITSFKFRVKISNDCSIFKCSDTLYNMAFASYKGETSQGYRSLYSSSSGIDQITNCPLSGAVKVKIDVNPTCPPYPDTSITACSPYNLSNIIPFRPGFTSFVNSVGNPVTQATSSGTYYAIRTLYQGFSWLPPCKDSIVINFTAPCSLPVSLYDFNISNRNTHLLISWSTVQEINNQYFEIERSDDGINFVKIHSENGALNSTSLKEYSFKDYNFPKINKVYYRLLQVDIYGNKKISPIYYISLKNRKENKLEITSIYPNPIKSSAIFGVYCNQSSKHTIKVYNTSGVLVFSLKKELKKGDNYINLDLANLSNSLYFLEIINDLDLNKTSTKFLKN